MMLTLRAAQKAVEHLLAPKRAVALVIPPGQREAPAVVAQEADVFGGLDDVYVCVERLGGAHICDDA